MLDSELKLCRTVERKGQLVVEGCEVAVLATREVEERGVGESRLGPRSVGGLLLHPTPLPY